MCVRVRAHTGQSQLIDLLVCKGASVNATDYHGLTPLHLACQHGYQGVTVNRYTQAHTGRYKHIDIHTLNHVYCLQLLLLHYKANTDAQDNSGNSPLLLACMYGHEDVSSTNTKRRHAECLSLIGPVTRIHVCQCVKALVYYDVQTCHLDLQNDKGDTALHTASRWGYEGIIQVLLENGANVHIVNKNKDSPLHCALNSKVSLRSRCGALCSLILFDHQMVEIST